MRNVVVLGMHRSGTSLVAGRLAAAGVYVGTSAELLTDQEDNPHGFWERLDVVALDDEILAARNASWFKPTLEQPLVARASEQQAIHRILAALPVGQSWLLKDPRMVLTWPLWREQVADAALVYVYRDPCSVAVSLKRRNGFPLAMGLALWERYNRMALEALVGADSVALAYDDITADNRAAFSGLLQSLAGFGVLCDTGNESGTYVAALGRSAKSATELTRADALLSESQQALADYCKALCANTVLPSLPAPDSRLSAQLDDLATALMPLASVVETRNEIVEINRVCEERTRQRDRSLAQLRSLEIRHSELADAHRDEVARHQELVTAHRDKIARHRESETALRDEIARHQELVAAHRELLDRYDELQQEHTLVLQKTDYLFKAMSHAYTKLLEYEKSAPGAISRAIGKLYKLLRRRSGANTAYDDILDDARRHFIDNDLEPPRKLQSKLSLLSDVVKYVTENPAGSARSFSIARIKRAWSIMLNSSTEDFDVWVSSRFPKRCQSERGFDPAALDASLDTRELVFKAVEFPRVSIVVPVYNNYRVTVSCLVALLENTADIPFAVIIGDDCSDDLTATIEQRVHNVLVVRSERNVGFLGNCNAAAQQARSDYILLLNNDTAVCPGWLQPMLDVFERDHLVGIVGPKLLFGDGKLQEAGGIIWRDASGWNYGRSDDPSKPAYNYLKEVDYVSGACLMVRRALWQQLQGFDTRFTPAYYEDSDLCFQAREAGYKVIYQPLSQVFHFEGVSSGTDLNSGMKSHQLANQIKFAEKWDRELQANHFDNAKCVFWARDRSLHRRTVLFIDHYVPHFDKDAGSRSTFMYVRLMVEMGYKVLFMGANFFPHAPYTSVLQQLGVEVLVGESIARNLDRWLQEHAEYIDCIFLHRPHVAEQFLDQLERLKPRPRIVFFGHDLHFLRISRQQDVTGDASLARLAENWRQREFAVFERVDKVYYPAQFEVDMVRAVNPELDLRAIPLYILEDKPATHYDFEQSSGILFVGGFNHPPNVDAVTWFVQEVLPLVSERYPDTHFHLVGSNPTAVVEALKSLQVSVYGYLPDAQLDALYRRVRLAVVPLRYGAGVKGKVLEAVQQQVPLVTTPVGAEGIPCAGEVMSIADGATEFAEEVMALLGGEPLRLARLDRYRDWMQQHFSRASVERLVRNDFGAPQRSTITDASA